MVGNVARTPANTGVTSQAIAQAMAADQAAQSAIKRGAAPLIQAVAQAAPTYTVGSATVVNMLGQATGLIRKFYLVVKGTINCASTFTLTATPFGLPNLLSNITFTDLNTRVRHNTTGLHMHWLQGARRGFPAGTALTAAALSDASGYGNNFLCNYWPSSVTGGTAKNFQFVWEIPIAYTDSDLRGAIWANQVTANNILTLTLNPNFFLPNGSIDISGAGYQASAALASALPTVTNLNFTLYQDMFVQIPAGQNGQPALPQMALAYAYCLLNVPAQALQANADNVFFAAPNRSILSHMLFWDNFGYTGPTGGDITSIKIQIANSLVVRQMEPGILAYLNRNLLGSDFPAPSSGGNSTDGFAAYYIDTRRRPLNVQTSGNVGLYFNPNTVETAANLNIGYEYLEVQSATFNAPGFGT